MAATSSPPLLCSPQQSFLHIPTLSLFLSSPYSLLFCGQWLLLIWLAHQCWLQATLSSPLLHHCSDLGLLEEGCFSFHDSPRVPQKSTYCFLSSSFLCCFSCTGYFPKEQNQCWGSCLPTIHPVVRSLLSAFLLWAHYIIRLHSLSNEVLFTHVPVFLS